MFLDDRIKSVPRLQFHANDVLRNVYFETLVERYPGAFEKVVLEPEMIGDERRGYPPDEAVFERVSGAKHGYRHVLLSAVGEDRRLARDGGGQVLDGGSLRLPLAPVRFADADMFDVQFFVGGVVRKDELAETLDAGVALNLDAEALFAPPGPVFLEPVGDRHFLDDTGLLRIIGLFLFGRLRSGSRRVLPLPGRLRGLGSDETVEMKRRGNEK